MKMCSQGSLSLALALCLGLFLCSPSTAADSRAGRQAPPEATSVAPQTDGEAAGPALDLNRMLREVEALKRFAGEEADTALRDLARDREALTAAVNGLRAEKTAVEQDVLALQARYNEQIAVLRELEETEREDMASRKALEGAARLTAGTIRERLATSAYTSSIPEMTGIVARITGSTEFPSYEDIKAVTDLLFAELEHAGRVDVTRETVTLPDGRTAEADVLRVGGLLAAARLDGNRHVYLQPVDGGKRLLEIRADIPSSATRLIEQALAGQALFPVDFSEGAVFRRFTGQKGFIEHILAGGPLIWPIMGLGIIALVFGLIRYARLMRTRFGNPRTLGEFFALVRGNNLDKARKLLEDRDTAHVPVYAVLRHMLGEWREGSLASMEKCRDEAILEQSAPLEKGIPFVAIAAAVAPLLGLLGTVTGMIGTFDVITIFGNSDPKQLSGGISVALVTTELGLVTAIPLMFLHFALSRRVARLVDDMEEKGAILIARTSAGGAG